MAEREAVEATVTGNDQQVGFRALVMKQAIAYNLAGSARNDANEIVHFTLQGDKQRIDSALAAIQAGTKRSSDLKITTTPTAIDPALNAFTIVAWTSSSREITNQYNLVFALSSRRALSVIPRFLAPISGEGNPPPCDLRYNDVDSVRVRDVWCELGLWPREKLLRQPSPNDQQVGFRAVVMRQAIEYNLAGSARNDANEIVHFTLQGDKQRIDFGARGPSRRDQKIV